MDEMKITRTVDVVAAEIRAEKRTVISSDKDLAVFETLFIQGQELANKLHGILLKVKGREDPAPAARTTRS